MFYFKFYLCAVVECPSDDYLESFVNHPAFARHQTGTANEDVIPYCIVHFTPQKVMDSPRYVNWMGKFGLRTRHIVVNEENECMGTEAMHRHQHKLHMLHPEIFPFLNEESFQKKTRVRQAFSIPEVFKNFKTINTSCFFLGGRSAHCTSSQNASHGPPATAIDIRHGERGIAASKGIRRRGFRD